MLNNYILRTASNIKRFSNDFLFEPENTATHSFEMGLLCINFSMLVPESNRDNMCYRCISHDLEEIISGDVRRPLKWANSELKRLIDKVSFDLLTPLVDENTLNDIKNAKDPEDVNGWLVGLADRVQCYLKMSKEFKFYGNKSLEKDLNIFEDVILQLIDAIEYYPYICDESKKALMQYITSLLTIY